MKNQSLHYLLVSIFCLLLSIPCFAKALPIIYIGTSSAVHLRSPEPVSYVDLPRGTLAGDLPLPSVVRLRLNEGFIGKLPEQDLGIVTITGEHYLSQYRLIYTSEESKVSAELEILPDQMVPLSAGRSYLSTAQIRAKAQEAISRKILSPLAFATSQKITIRLNQLLSCDEFIFVDLSFFNTSQLSYDKESLSFVIGDNKILKATNYQQFTLEPRFVLSPMEGFKKEARNIYVLPKATFSSSKRLLITLSEKQPSSRLLQLSLSYGDLLRADSF